MNFGEILQSKRWKTFTGYVYNLGASVVLLGALFKLQHWAFSGPLLILGLCTEAFIFFVSAFEPPMELPEWSKVYPELRDDYDSEAIEDASSSSGLSQFLEKADISPDLISKVSKGLTDLSNTASSISDITSATLATDVYVKNMNSASESMSTFAEINNQANENINDSVNNLVNSYSSTASKLSEKGDELINQMAVSGAEFTNQLAQSGSKLVGSYSKVAEILDQGFSDLEKNSKNYGENMTKMNKNLEALTTSYEVQLKDTNDQLEASKKFFTEVAQMNQLITSSLEEIKKYQSNAAELNKHLEALNSVYGNMLGAMNYKK